MSLTQRLVAFTTNASDFYDFCPGFLRSQLEHRLEQVYFWITNGELGCMHSNRYTPRAGGCVVTRQSTLPTFIQLAIPIECQRMRRNHHPRKKFFTERHQNFPSRV